MNTIYLLIAIIGAVIGLGSTFIIIFLLFATIGKKIYRKIRYGVSLYD